MEQTFLVVGYRSARYAVDALAVREVIWLPELAPIEELPPFICGVFNLRGQVVPVMDLGLRFSHGRSPRRLQDRVVVIEEGRHCLGILVNELHDVVSVPSAAIEPAGHFQLPGGETRFLRGAVKLEDALLMLLDIAVLLHEAADLELPDIDSADLSTTPTQGEDDEIFRTRARLLAQVPGQKEHAAQLVYALIRLDGELFGLDVGVVGEFVHLRGLTPIPCSPAHVAGHMNLRGHILTLIDIRPVLGLGAALAAPQVVVLKIGAIEFAVLAEAIEDVVSFSPANIARAADAPAEGSANLCHGVLTLAGRVASLIDSSRLLAALQARSPATIHNPPHQP